MLQASLYESIYLFFVVVLTIYATARLKTADVIGPGVSPNSNIGGYIVAIGFTLFIGFRPLSGRYFVDMANYNEIYYGLIYGKPFQWNTDISEIIYSNFINWLGANYYEITVFFVIMAAIYFIAAFKAMTRLFPTATLLAYTVFLGAFSTFSYATNGIRAGVAASLFLCALSYRKNWKIALLLLFLSIGFHNAMVIPIAGFVLAYFFRKPKYYLVFWIFALVMALLHITAFQEWFSGFEYERSSSYLATDKNWGGKTGFRYDFVLYSMLPVAVGYWAIFKRNVKSIQLNFIYNIYLFSNAIWMLCMYASFTNRIAYLSWILYPVVTIYPFFCESDIINKTVRLKQIIWFQLLFTLFMSIVYYG